MKKLSSSAIFLLLAGLLTLSGQESHHKTMGSSEPALQLTIIYDNYQAREGLETDWGFAALVESRGHKILFDAGNKSSLYEKNMKILGIVPTDIPSLFISHKHGDHTAGLPWITGLNPNITCYLPTDYASELSSKRGLPEISVTSKEAKHLHGPFYTSGDNYESFTEQALVVNTAEGGILITGCGHPGAVNMVQKVKEDLGIEIHTVIGGLHLMQKNESRLSEIASTLKAMGVKQICPTHCTGEKSIAHLKEAFGEGYIQGGTGKVITIQ